MAERLLQVQERLKFTELFYLLERSLKYHQAVSPKISRIPMAKFQFSLVEKSEIQKGRLIAMFKGIFGGLFDFDGDGEINVLEQLAEFAFLDHLSGDADDTIDADFDTLDGD